MIQGVVRTCRRWPRATTIILACCVVEIVLLVVLVLR